MRSFKSTLPHPPCACMQWPLRVAHPPRVRPAGVKSLQRPPSPLGGGENHHLRKSRRAKCALHWHSPEQKIPIFVSTCIPASAASLRRPQMCRAHGRPNGLRKLVPGWGERERAPHANRSSHPAIGLCSSGSANNGGALCETCVSAGLGHCLSQLSQTISLRIATWMDGEFRRQ